MIEILLKLTWRSDETSFAAQDKILPHDRSLVRYIMLSHFFRRFVFVFYRLIISLFLHCILVKLSVTYKKGIILNVRQVHNG